MDAGSLYLKKPDVVYCQVRNVPFRAADPAWVWFA